RPGSSSASNSTPLLIAAMGPLNSWQRRADSSSKTRKSIVEAARRYSAEKDEGSTASVTAVCGLKRSIPCRAICDHPLGLQSRPGIIASVSPPSSFDAHFPICPTNDPPTSSTRLRRRFTSRPPAAFGGEEGGGGREVFR